VTSHSEPVAASSILFNPVWRKIAVQVGLAAVVAFLIYAAANNAIERMHEQGTASGFQFLWRPAGFDISQRPIEFAAKSSSNARAFAVGLLNTLIVASLGIVLATIIGFVVGISRLSTNWLLARLATVYVELIRNIPLLLQLYVWYKAVLKPLP